MRRLLVGCFLVTACAAPAPGGGAPPGLFDPEVTTETRCLTDGPALQPGRIDVAILRSPEVDDEALGAITGTIAAVFAPHGITFQATSIATVATGPVLTGSDAEITRVLATVGVPGDSPEAATLSLALVAAPLADLLADRATPSRPELLLVIVPRVAAPDSPALRVLGEADGLGLSPSAGVTGHGAALLEALAIGADFTPTAIVGTRGGAAAAGWTAAHEVGHALGLVHGDAPGNLMAPGRPSCMPGLTADQLAVVARSPAVQPMR